MLIFFPVRARARRRRRRHNDAIKTPFMCDTAAHVLCGAVPPWASRCAAAKCFVIREGGQKRAKTNHTLYCAPFNWRCTRKGAIARRMGSMRFGGVQQRVTPRQLSCVKSAYIGSRRVARASACVRGVWRVCSLRHILMMVRIFQRKRAHTRTDSTRV